MIDWTKPLELADGTPVSLEPHDPNEPESCLTNGPDGAPDSEGDYWIIRDDGEPLRGAMYSLCVSPDEGCSGFNGVPLVRNREQPA